MAVLKNRVGVVTSTTGTGTITLGVPLTAAQAINNAGWQSFATGGVANGDIVRYLILDSNGAWEYGLGTFASGPGTLTRPAGAMNGTVPGQRSSTGSLLALSGTAQVFITAVSEDITSFTSQTTAPTAPEDGDLWYNSTTGLLSIAVGGVWTQISGGFQVGIQRFFGSGTYTPMAGLSYAIVEVIAGGGGGGSAIAATSVLIAAGGGGSGGYSRRVVTAAQIGAAQTITVGAAGLGVAGGNGTNGGDSSFGTLVTAKGGIGAVLATPGTGVSPGGAGGTITGAVGDVVFAGDPGTPGCTGTANTYANTGKGGSSAFGGGGLPATSASPGSGNPASNYGSGGGGAVQFNSASGNPGGNGSAGIVIVTEYAGSPTGASGGNVVSSGVPLNGQMAEWASSNTIRGTNAAGLLTLITSQVVSTPVALLDFTTGIDATYDQYEIRFFGFKPAVEGPLVIRFSSNAGSSWDASANYQNAFHVLGSISTAADAQQTGQTQIQIGSAQNISAATASGSGIIRLNNLRVAAEMKIVRYDLAQHDSIRSFHYSSGAGGYPISTVVNGIRLFSTNGNIAAGTFNLYGVRK